MKRLLFVFILICLLSFLLAQKEDNKDTIIKLQTEQRISERIENLLYPFVGKSVVIIDLNLNYPTLNLPSFYPDDLSTEKGAIQKKKAEIMFSNVKKSGNNQIKILTKKVSVYLDRAIDLEMENFVRQSVIEWLKLDPLKGDVITLFKTLTFSLTESEQVSVVETPEENIEETGIVTSPKPIPTNAWIILIIGVVLIAILIILNTTFRSGIQALSNSIGGINKSNAEQSQTIRAKLSGAERKSTSTILDDSYRKPLKISILENQMEKEKELVDFSFLENLTFPEFSKLIDDESFNDIEKSFILSNLPVEFVQNFLSEYSGDLNNLIKTMLSDVSLQKDKMTLLRTKLIENHSQLLEERALKTNGKDTLVKFINNLSYDESRELFEKVNILDEETGAEIRDQIFLFEDVYKIEDDLIKELIFNIDHELMVIFLASVEENIKDKFINNMSARIASMFREDIKFMGEVPDDEKKNAINKTIDTIRVILNYK